MGSISWRWKEFKIEYVNMRGHFGIMENSVRPCHVYVISDVVYPDGFRLDHDVKVYVCTVTEGELREGSPIPFAPRFLMSVRHRDYEYIYEDLEFGPVRNWEVEGKNFVLLTKAGRRGTKYITPNEPIPVDYISCSIARHKEVCPGRGWNRLVALVNTGDIHEMIRIGLARYRQKLKSRS